MERGTGPGRGVTRVFFNETFRLYTRNNACVRASARVLFQMKCLVPQFPVKVDAFGFGFSFGVVPFVFCPGAAFPLSRDIDA